MIINLLESRIFTQDPDLRFSKEYALPEGSWIELWRRYKLLDYSNGDMRDYLFIKHARNVDWTSMNRWIARSRIYEISQPLIKKGVRQVNTEVFGELEELVMNELVKSLKYGSVARPRSII